jgi:PAS domain S-box-containing protein
MRSLLAASDDCIKVLTLDGKLSFMSEGGQRTMDVSDFNAIKGCPWPDFWSGPKKADVAFALAEAREGRSSRFQGYADTMAGRSRYWDVQVSPIMGADGTPEAVLSVSRDITALKEAENQLRLLSEEMQHRMKNVFAMVQAIAIQTLNQQHSIETLKKDLLARLNTLKDAQDLLTSKAWERASIIEVAHATLKPHAVLSRFEISGPELTLSSRIALGLALGLHELATNANKYGALSNGDGLVTLKWSIADDSFLMVWEERGGPTVLQPTRTGFGARLIERALAGYFSGKTTLAYNPEGVIFTLEAPLSALALD